MSGNKMNRTTGRVSMSQYDKGQFESIKDMVTPVEGVHLVRRDCMPVSVHRVVYAEVYN